MWEWFQTVATSWGFTFISGSASIVSLIVSAYVAWRLTSLRRVILFRARLPELRDLIRDAASELSKLLESYETNRQLILDTLAKVQPAVTNVGNKVYGKTRQRAIRVSAEIEGYLSVAQGPDISSATGRDAQTEQRCREIRLLMIGLIETLEQLRADDNLRVN